MTDDNVISIGDFLKKQEASAQCECPVSLGLLGLLTHVNTSKSSKPGKVELVFDTGTELFIPNDLFKELQDKLIFHLKERD